MPKSQIIPVSEDIEQVEEGEGHWVLLEPGLHVVQLGVQALPRHSWEKEGGKGVFSPSFRGWASHIKKRDGKVNGPCRLHQIATLCE